MGTGEAEQDEVGDDDAEVEGRVAPLGALEVELGDGLPAGRAVDEDVLGGDVGVDQDAGLVAVVPQGVLDQPRQVGVGGGGGG